MLGLPGFLLAVFVAVELLVLPDLLVELELGHLLLHRRLTKVLELVVAYPLVEDFVKVNLSRPLQVLHHHRPGTIMTSLLNLALLWLVLSGTGYVPDPGNHKNPGN